MRVGFGPEPTGSKNYLLYSDSLEMFTFLDLEPQTASQVWAEYLQEKNHTPDRASGFQAAKAPVWSTGKDAWGKNHEEWLGYGV